MALSEDNEAPGLEPSGFEDLELWKDIRLVVDELVEKVIHQEKHDHEGDNEAEENENVPAVAVMEDPVGTKEIRDFNNNIVFSDAMGEGIVGVEGAEGQESQDAVDVGDQEPVNGELGIGDYAGADASYHCDVQDREIEDMKDAVDDIKQDLLLLQSELSFTESMEERADNAEHDQQEMFEDFEAEQELFHFRSALASANLDNGTIDSFIEIKPIVVDQQEDDVNDVAETVDGDGLIEDVTDQNGVCILCFPRTLDTEIQNGSSDNNEIAIANSAVHRQKDDVNDAADTVDDIGLTEDATSASQSNVDFLYPPPIQNPGSQSGSSSDDELEDVEESQAKCEEQAAATHPFTDWVRECQQYIRSKSNSSCREPRKIKSIRFASQTQIIPSSAKYVSDEESDQITVQDFPPSCLKNGSIKGEGLPLLCKSPDEDEEAESSAGYDRSRTLQENQLEGEQSDYDQVDGADERSCTESIECFSDEEDPLLFQEENAASDVEDMKYPVQKLSNKSFLNLYMTESQKSCDRIPNTQDRTKTGYEEYELTEAEIRMIRENSQDEDLLDGVSVLLKSVGSATSIDDEFLHSEEWKELEQAKAKIHSADRSASESGDEDSLKARQLASRYDHRYSHLTDKAKVVVKDKINTRNSFLDSFAQDPVKPAIKRKSTPRIFQFADLSEFEFRYEYNHYNNYCITKTGLDSPRISPRGSTMQNSIKMQVQSVLYELRNEENLVRQCSRASKSSDLQDVYVFSHNGSSWRQSDRKAGQARSAERVFDITDLEREADARASVRSRYEFEIAIKTPSLVGFPRTPPDTSQGEEEEAEHQRKKYASNTASCLPAQYRTHARKEVGTDLPAADMTLYDDGDKPQHQKAKDLICPEEDLDKLEEENPQPSTNDMSPGEVELPLPVTPKPSLSFFRRLFGRPSLHQVSPSNSEIVEQQQPKKQSFTNLLWSFVKRN